MRAVEKPQPKTDNSPVDSRIDWLYVLMIMLVTVCFWISDQNWDASPYFSSIDEANYTGSENATADRLAEVNASSSSARIILALAGVVCIWYRRDLILRTDSALLWTTIALICILYASFFWSVNRPHTLFKLIVLLCFGLSCVGVGWRFTLRQVLQMICIACAGYILFGVVAELSHGSFRPWRSDYRFVGNIHPNSNALYGAILCLGSRMYFVKDRSKLLAFIMIALGVGCILLTKSRASLASILLALLLTQILATRRENRLVLIVGGIFAAGLLAIVPIFINAQSAGNVGNIAAMGRTEEVGSLTGRLPLWEELGEHVWKSPILGYGYLALWDSNRVEYLSELFKWEIPHGHNSYIDIALDIGIFGACLWIAWHLSGVWEAGKLFVETREPEYAVVFGLVVIAIVNGFAESIFKLPGFLMFTVVASFACILNKNTAPIKLKDNSRTRLRAPVR